MMLYEHYLILNELEKKTGKDMKYGLPDKSKFPLYDESHTRSALKFFNYADPSDEERLATAIKKQMKVFGINDVNIGKENRFSKYYKPVLKESVLDPIQKTRSSDLFTANEVMKPEVRAFIESSFTKWVDTLKVKNFSIECFKLIGSSSGFQYTDVSDIDVQVFLKMNPGSDFSETRKLIRILPNGNILQGTDHPINYFMIDSAADYDFDNVENLYNFKTEKWEKKSNKSDIEIPVMYARNISRFFTNGFDLVLGQFERDKQYLNDAARLNPEKQDISEKEKTDAINNAINDLKADIDSMRIAEQLLHGFLLKAYAEKTPFKVSIQYSSDDPRFSMNNLIYKTLDKFEYKTKLWEKIKEGREILSKFENKGKLAESWNTGSLEKLKSLLESNGEN